MTSRGFGTKADGFEVTQERGEVAHFEIEVPKGAKHATIFTVAHLTAYNSDEGGAGFFYADVYAGDDFGLETFIDYDTGKWNNLVSSNQSEVDVSDAEVVVVGLHVRSDEALDLQHTTATINGIVVFE